MVKGPWRDKAAPRFTSDLDWMEEALRLGERGRGSTAPNPSVGCVIVKDDRIVGRGCTQPGGRPHAEAVALTEAGENARGATVFVTLEPCAVAGRGPSCAGELVNAGVARVVSAVSDPCSKVNGNGFNMLRSAGVSVEVGLGAALAEFSMGGFLMRQRRGRPCITLKLAMSLDGKIAMNSGESRWITGREAREDAHRERARTDMILVGRGTYEADAPRLDVRLCGSKDRTPRRAILCRGEPPEGWAWVKRPEDVTNLVSVNDLMVEGGAGAASAFLAADLVDRLLIYRAPILLGGARSATDDIGLTALADAHGRWQLREASMLGLDRREVYERTTPTSPPCNTSPRTEGHIAPSLSPSVLMDRGYTDV